MFTFSQSSGMFNQDGALVGVGYAGFGYGKRNPAAQATRGIGPLPVGMYTIGSAETHPRLGPLTMRLTPDATNEMFGRDMFFIHGENPEHPGESSDGCIVLDRDARTEVMIAVAKGENRLEVTT